MDYLYSILNNSEIPALSALVLGVLTALNPCTLAMTITAVGFIARRADGGSSVIFWQGLLYTIGRVIAYTLLGIVLIYFIHQGKNLFHLQDLFGEWGEKLLGPAMIIIGLLLLFGHALRIKSLRQNREKKPFRGGVDSLLLGMLFAMSFCPASAVFYFAMLIPLSASVSGGYLLPIIYAVATALPVIVITLLLAYFVHNVARLVSLLNTFQRWFNAIVAILFIVVGVWHTIEDFL